jgi:uncharacterized protein YecT (DUF1311 family)
LALMLYGAIGWAYDDEMVAKALANCSANQMTLNICSWHRAELAEQEMLQTYARLRSQVLGTPALAALESAQAHWLTYRASECRYRISGLTPDGSMVAQWRDDCRRTATEARTLELRKHLGCVSQGCPGR